MKYTLVFIFGIGMLINPTVNYSNCDGKYVKLDKALIDLLYHCNANDYEGVEHALDGVDQEWNIIVNKNIIKTTEAILIVDFNKKMDDCIRSMNILFYERDFIGLEKNTKNMLQKLKWLRDYENKLNGTEYPLDQILNMVEYYSEIEETVYDQMFGLKYWFEFEDSVNAFQCEWNAYAEIDTVDITECFSSITKMEHDKAKGKIEECLAYFLDSLESGFRSDFEIPCDELGVALDDLLYLYADLPKGT